MSASKASSLTGPSARPVEQPYAGGREDLEAVGAAAESVRHQPCGLA